MHKRKLYLNAILNKIIFFFWWSFTALFIENVEEYDASEDKEKSIPIKDRMNLLSDFDSNSIDSVFSGHTHFENLDPPAYGAVQQYVLTSISSQNSWKAKENWGPNGEVMKYGTCTPSFYMVNSRSSGVTLSDMLELRRSEQGSRRRALGVTGWPWNLTYVFLELGMPRAGTRRFAPDSAHGKLL